MFNKKYLIKELKLFLKIYNKRPIKDNFSGMKIEHCFAVYILLKKIKPKYVIESGVWKGQSTWLIKNTLKNVKLYSIDIDLSQKELHFDDVKYLNKDITKYNWRKLNKNKTLIIFDDHVCFSKRINFLIKNNFKHIIFDDNLPNNFISYYTPKMFHEDEILIKKRYIKYFNIKRIIIFLYECFLLNKFNKGHKIFLLNNSIKIIYPALINQNIKKLFKLFKRKTKIYYEFPPIIKFNIKKRFSKVNKQFNVKLDKFAYKVKDPITNIKDFKFNKNILNEMSSQYGNICYIKFE